MGHKIVTLVLQAQPIRFWIADTNPGKPLPRPVRCGSTEDLAAFDSFGYTTWTNHINMTLCCMRTFDKLDMLCTH